MERPTRAELEQLRSLLRGEREETEGGDVSRPGEGDGRVDDERLLAWQEGTLPPALQRQIDREVGESPELAARAEALRGEDAEEPAGHRLGHWIWAVAALILIAVAAWRWFQDPERALLRGDVARAWSAVADELPPELRAELLAEGGLDPSQRLEAALQSRAQREAVGTLRIVAPQSNLIVARPSFVWRGKRGAADSLKLYEVGVEEPVLELDPGAAQTLGQEHTLELPPGFVIEAGKLYRWELTGPTDRATASFRRFDAERREAHREAQRRVREAAGAHPTLERYLSALVDDLAGLRVAAWRKLTRLAQEHPDQPLFRDAWRAAEIGLGLRDE